MFTKAVYSKHPLFIRDRVIKRSKPYTIIVKF